MTSPDAGEVRAPAGTYQMLADIKEPLGNSRTTYLVWTEEINPKVRTRLDIDENESALDARATTGQRGKAEPTRYSLRITASERVVDLSVWRGEPGTVPVSTEPVLSLLDEYLSIVADAQKRQKRLRRDHLGKTINTRLVQ